LFSRFFDFGYAFSKTLAIITLSYAIFFLSTVKVIPFSQLTIYLLLIIGAGINIYLFIKDKTLIKFIRAPLKEQFFLFFEEALFLLSLLFLAYIKAQEP